MKIMRRVLLTAVIVLSLASTVGAAVIDRVVAFVGDEAITLSELQESYMMTASMRPDASRSEVLNTMINRALMLREARKLRMEAESEDAVINEYIDLKVRAFIRISDADMENFYNENKSEFKGAKLTEVREQIETLLREKEVNSALRKHIEALRAGAYIKIVYLPE